MHDLSFASNCIQNLFLIYGFVIIPEQPPFISSLKTKNKKSVAIHGMFIQSGAGKVYIMFQQKRAHANHLFSSLFEIKPASRMPVELCQTTMSICELAL